MGSTQTLWPASALHEFTVRMAGHGFSVSRTLMTYDRKYALEQLQLAHTLADLRLREMAMELFRDFERRQSGVALVSPVAA